MMLRCFLRPRGRLSIPPLWLPSLASSGSRSIKLSNLGPLAGASTQYATGAVPVSRQAWLKQLANNDIGHHAELQTIGSFKNIVTVKFAPRHVRKFTDEVYFTDIGHPLAEFVVRRYLRAHKEKPLWCLKSAPVAEKSIVRGKFKYRAHAAFKQALRNTGYDADGRRLAESNGGARNGGVPELFGTIQILSFAPKEIHNVPFSTLRGFFEKTVGMLEQKLGKAASSRYAGRTRETPRVQMQRPQHQTRTHATRRTESRSPGNREWDVSRRGSPRGS